LQEFARPHLKIEAAIQSQELNPIGLVVDFKEMKRRLKEVLVPWIMSASMTFRISKMSIPPRKIWQCIFIANLKKSCGPFYLKHVRVWESETSSVTYWE